MELFLTNQETLAIIMLIICIAPIFALIIWAIIRTVGSKTDIQRKHLENISHEDVDLEQQKIFYDAYGGEDNIESIVLTMSRITVKVKNIESANAEKLKELGAKGVLLVGDEVKCSFGDRASYIYKMLQK